MGQIAEVKGRLSTGLAHYMLAKNGAKPGNANALLTYINSPNALCPTSLTTEGDFEFKCTTNADNKTITITVSKVKGQPVNPNVSDNFTIQ